MPLTIGSRIGVYDIVAAIGAGGMGEVYRGRDTSLERDVAIKVLPDVFAEDPDRAARFEREARVLASLNHPNIAAIHGLERSGARSFWCWSSCRARPLPSGLEQVRCRSARRCHWRGRSRTPCRRLTTRASSIAT